MASIREEYDLLICDLMLPDLEGTEIVRALKAQSPRLPVMVMSALPAAEWEQQCLDAGATHYMEKPLDIDELRFEVGIVEKARLNLSIIVVDGDAIHRTRLTKALVALGCDVQGFACAADAQKAVEHGSDVGLLVVDVDTPDAVDVVRWAKKEGLPAFGMTEAQNAEAEDKLMRAGAAFLINKPVDIDNLLTQAAFMVSG